MFISDFSADVSTLNFGTEKDTNKVHETLHANGIFTISELCRLSKKNIESLQLDPALVEFHLKKEGLSLGMTEDGILRHQKVVLELFRTNQAVNSIDKNDLLDQQVKEIVDTIYSTEGNWPERFYELTKELFLKDHCIFRSTNEKFQRAISIAHLFVLRFMYTSQKMIESEKKSN